VVGLQDGYTRGCGEVVIYFYCEVCGDHQEVDIEPLKKDDLNPCPWGDIVCKACHFVIATVSADVEGKVVFLPEGLPIGDKRPASLGD
jgi:hypothetical protein